MEQVLTPHTSPFPSWRSIAGWIALGALITVAVIAASPLLLLFTLQLFTLPPEQWSLLSNIGQSFGGVAAILSAIALLGVTYSVRVQARQTLEQRVEAVSNQQRELIFKLLEFPDLGSVHDGRDLDRADRERSARDSYRNLWFIYLFNAYRLQEIPEKSIRQAMNREYFTSSEGTSFWRVARTAFEADVSESARQRFIEMVDDECMKAEMRLSAEVRNSRPSSTPYPGYL